MSEVVVRAEGLGKRYRIGRREAPYKTLRESLAGLALAPARRVRTVLRGEPLRREPETIWALRDVDLEVGQGEVLGVIGRNGAGKSTLLKILARITEPTTGRVELRGRVGSLLEVGTGFHPELSGRENIYLNGAILGMRKAEIDRRFDEIVAFAEIDRFLDTPVKHYSSGMYVRLAFAVAAHMQPEILLVDEVLAVGDAVFQKKCMGKMDEIARKDRTVLFVSHSIPAITRICRRAILLSEGAIVANGEVGQVVEHYITSGSTAGAQRTWPSLSSAPGNEKVRLVATRVRDRDGNPTPQVDIRSEFGVDLEYSVLAEGVRLVPSVHLFNDTGVNLFTSINSSSPEWYNSPHRRGTYRATCWIPGNLLAEGRVNVRVAVAGHNPDVVHADQWDALAFHVVDQSDGDGARGGFARDFPGVVRPALRWSTEVIRCDEPEPGP